MSTQQPRPTAKAVAKRRAASRRNRRVRLRQLGALFLVGIFILGTATTAFVFQQTANQQAATTAAGSTPGSTVVEATASIPSPTPGNAVQQIIDKADQAAAQNDWKTAAGFYKSALPLSPSNATLLFKYGKALGNTGDYAGAVDNLQQALALNPSASFAAEAQQLVDTYKTQVTPGANLQVQGTVTGTGTITATAPITK